MTGGCAAIGSLFAAEREQANTVLRAIRDAAARLRPAPLGLWLYGSAARGADHPSSDIDVVLVSARDQPSQQADAVRKRLTTLLLESAHGVSLVALGPGDVRRLASKRDEFWRGPERDAVVLAGDAPAGVLETVAGLRVRS